MQPATTLTGRTDTTIARDRRTASGGALGNFHHLTEQHRRHTCQTSGVEARCLRVYDAHTIDTWYVLKCKVSFLPGSVQPVHFLHGSFLYSGLSSTAACSIGQFLVSLRSQNLFPRLFFPCPPYPGWISIAGASYMSTSLTCWSG